MHLGIIIIIIIIIITIIISSSSSSSLLLLSHHHHHHLVAEMFPEIEDHDNTQPLVPWDTKNEYHVSRLVVYFHVFSR
jgi:hypothetical protein